MARSIEDGPGRFAAGEEQVGDAVASGCGDERGQVVTSAPASAGSAFRSPRSGHGGRAGFAAPRELASLVGRWRSAACSARDPEPRLAAQRSPERPEAEPTTASSGGCPLSAWSAVPESAVRVPSSVREGSRDADRPRDRRVQCRRCPPGRCAADGRVQLDAVEGDEQSAPDPSRFRNRSIPSTCARRTARASQSGSDRGVQRRALGRSPSRRSGNSSAMRARRRGWFDAHSVGQRQRNAINQGDAVATARFRCGQGSGNNQVYPASTSAASSAGMFPRQSESIFLMTGCCRVEGRRPCAPCVRG